MRVHPRPVDPEQRLGHEGRIHTVLLGDLLDHVAVGDAVVGHVQPVGVAHVDLVLRRAHLVMQVLDRDAHALQRQHRLLAQIGRRVDGGLLEVAARIQRMRHPGLVQPEVEVLELGTDLERIEAERLHPLQGHPQHMPGIGLIGIAVGGAHIADHAGDIALAGLPRQHLEGGGVGHRDHVRLLDRVEAGHRGAVEAHPRSNAPSSSDAVMAKLFSRPTTSVNHSRTNLSLAPAPRAAPLPAAPPDHGYLRLSTQMTSLTRFTAQKNAPRGRIREDPSSGGVVASAGSAVGTDSHRVHQRSDHRPPPRSARLPPTGRTGCPNTAAAPEPPQTPVARLDTPGQRSWRGRRRRPG